MPQSTKYPRPQPSRTLLGPLPDLSPKPLDYRDTELFGQMRRLKVANPALRIMVSIGGA